MRKSLPILLLVSFLASSSRLGAEPSKRSFDNIVKMSVSAAPEPLKRGETGTWTFTMEIAEGWHTYPMVQPDPNAQNYRNQFDFANPKNVVFVGDFVEPAPHVKPEPDLDIKELREYAGKVTWERKFVVLPNAEPGKSEIAVPVKLLVCDEKGCLPPKKLTIPVPITISADPAVPVEPPYQAAVDKALKGPDTKPEVKPPVKPQTKDTEYESSKAYKEAMENVQNNLLPLAGSSIAKGDLLSFMLTGVFFGFISLITPCVFPMIPITVSFFLKQSEKEHHKPLTTALVYCGTIILVLTIAAVLLISFFRALSTNAIMNFAIGAIFIWFSLSLFGMYEIELPSFMVSYTSAREGQGGHVGTVFMALTFTIVSFACVAPFLGGFGGTAAGQQLTWTERILGGLAFSTTFAAPFFVLALFPSLLRKMPKSGVWLNNVKVVMGFIELGAAVGFFRLGELRLFSQSPQFFTFELVLGLWVALCLLCGLYLLNVFRLPHDTPIEHLGVMRMLFGLLFLGLAMYLIPGLFAVSVDGQLQRQRPKGEVFSWIEAFLLPDSQHSGLAWSADLPKALAEANKDERSPYVFIDFTGKTCKNCKLNEENIFTKEDIRKLLEKYKLVQLYTDAVPNDLYPPSIRATLGSGTTRQDADAEVNLEFQKAAFNTEQLPLYVILEPLKDGKIKTVGIYERGKIDNKDDFAEFLRKPFESGQARAQN